MKSAINFADSSHWYDKLGKAQHDADLRVARKGGLYPSPTSIEKDVFKNEFLERYKLNQLAIAACGTFKQAHESDEDYVNRIYEISTQHRDEAANFGKELHDAIEKYPQLSLDPKLHPYVEKFAGWYDTHIESVVESESVLVDDDIGVAGRCDCVAIGKGPFAGQVILPDWKSQGVAKTDSGKKVPKFYPSWGRQLSFYASAYAKRKGTFPDVPTCVSLVIDSNEPDIPFMKVWTKEEIRLAYKQFVFASWFWFSGMGKRKAYWPQPKGPFDLTSSVPLL